MTLTRRSLMWLLLAGLQVWGVQAEGRDIVPVQKSGELVVGKPVFVSAATVVCGPLEAENPFNAALYGKVSGDNPVGAPGSKIVLYTRALDANFLRLAAALDHLVGKNKPLANSLVIVMDQKGAQRTGYTLEELEQRRSAIRKIVTEHKMGNLSFFLSAPNADSISPRLGLSDANNVLVVGMSDSVPPGPRPRVRWLLPLDTTKLDTRAIGNIALALKTALVDK